jgi:cytochrome d ubiquinol oxidase subunit I
MDTLILSRIQFGANISFHILFPTVTIALGWAGCCWCEFTV